VKILADPRTQVLLALFATTVLFLYVVRRVLHHLAKRAGREGAVETRGLWREVLHAALGPLSLLIWYYGFYAMARVAIAGGWLPQDWQWTQPVLHEVAGIGLLVSVLWFFFRATRLLDRHLDNLAKRTPSKIDDVLLPLLGTALRVLVPIVALFLFIRLWPLSEQALEIVQKILAIALIGAVTWVLRRAIILIEAAVLQRESATNDTDYAARALITRVSVLRKIALVLITMFALSGVLMLFPEVRHVGQSILASAGIAGIVLGFAAQKTLGNLLAGVQIALTQPVRIGDLVMIEGEVGNIEEITLTYVVVRIWDLRRLVLPISYLIEKPIQNWTRTSGNVLTPLTLRVDFTMSVEPFRRYMKTVIEQSPNWDKKVFGVQVTNADQTSMEVRILGSAASAGDSFNLQCELREKAIEYLCRNQPDALPAYRTTPKVPNRQADGIDVPFVAKK
jgi:small-conductance mechanosensitive channel